MPNFKTALNIRKTDPNFDHNLATKVIHKYNNKKRVKMSFLISLPIIFFCFNLILFMQNNFEKNFMVNLEKKITNNYSQTKYQYNLETYSGFNLYINDSGDVAYSY